MTPEELERYHATIRRRYAITVHHKHGRRLFPYWATMIHGFAHVGEGGWGFRARTERRLLYKAVTWIYRDAERQGIQDPQIELRRI